MKRRATVSLFAGVGGFDYAMDKAGCEVVAQVEKEPFCLAVLETHWPKVPKFTDVKEFGASRLEFPVRTFLSPESAPDSQENALDSFTSLRACCASFDPLGLSSRMYPDFSVQTTEETLRKSSAFSWSNAGMGFRGACSTASISESPNVAVACSLSDILETLTPPYECYSSKKMPQWFLGEIERRTYGHHVSFHFLSGQRASSMEIFQFLSRHVRIHLRVLTVTECERLQGLPGNWTLCVIAPSEMP